MTLYLRINGFYAISYLIIYHTRFLQICQVFPKIILISVLG